MNPLSENSMPQLPSVGPNPAEVFWRVEGSLLNFSAVRSVAFFTWNAQGFAERWARRGGLTFLAVAFPFLYAAHRVLATRVLYALLRGVSRDRLDLLGEEYFQYVIKPRLKRRGLEKLRERLGTGQSVVLVSHGLDHVLRPLAQFLGIELLVANRLEFRDGRATGRLLEPVIRPRGGLAWLTGRGADGSVSPRQWPAILGLAGRPEALQAAIRPARREFPVRSRTLVLFDPDQRIRDFSVHKTLAGKHILLIGVTGFIGKVWLEKLLRDCPDIGRIYLLIRRQRGNSGQRRFEKVCY